MNKITAKLTRSPGPKQTIGNLEIFEDKELALSFITLEPPWVGNMKNISSIPTGKYPVKKWDSPNHGKCFKIFKTGHRTDILIHAGNFVSNTKGCILVGGASGDLNGDGLPDVMNSKAALRALLDFMPDKFRLEIV